MRMGTAWRAGWLPIAAVQLSIRSSRVRPATLRGNSCPVGSMALPCGQIQLISMAGTLMRPEATSKDRDCFYCWHEARNADFLASG